jgi:tricorn protease-like protein
MFSPDGRRILSVSADKTARLWNVETGEQIGLPLTGHTGVVSGAAFSSDGRRIVTASWDKTVRLWDTDARGSIALLAHPDRVMSVAFSPDGRRIVTGSSDGTVRLWDVFADTRELISQAKMAVPRCLTAEQREASYFLAAAPPAWCIKMAKWPYQTAAWKAWLFDKSAGKNPPLQAERSGATPE